MMHIKMYFDAETYEYVIHFTDSYGVLREVCIARHDIAPLLEQFKEVIAQTNQEYPEE